MFLGGDNENRGGISMDVCFSGEMELVRVSIIYGLINYATY